MKNIQMITNFFLFNTPLMQNLTAAKKYTRVAVTNTKLSFKEARHHCKRKFGGDLWGSSEKWLSVDGRKLF